MYDLLLVSWFRSRAPARRCTICCCCLGLEVAPALKCTICCRCLGVEVVPHPASTKMYDLLPQNVDLLPVSWSIGAPAVRCTICCRCLDLEVAPQHKDVRFVAGVLVSKWCPSTKMYDFLAVSWSRWCPSAKMYDLLPVSWFRSGGPRRRCTTSCRCLGLLPVSWCRSGAQH